MGDGSSGQELISGACGLSAEYNVAKGIAEKAGGSQVRALHGLDFVL